MEQEIPGQLVLKPGEVIKAVIDHDHVKILAKKLYGITVLKLTELNGYDDKNYFIIEDTESENSVITNRCADGYVLKIMNSLDSQNSTVVKAQNAIMNFLHSTSISCPKPVRNVLGCLYSMEMISGKWHAVRLLEYIPGVLFKDVPVTESLIYQLGEYVAKMDNKLQKFNHPGLVSREHIWMLTKVPELDNFKHVIKDSEKLELVETVIEEFKKQVIPQLEELDRGVIHGDINEMNVLVAPTSNSSDYRIVGIIDFGDSQYSHYVFEVAIAMTYMMLMTGDPRSGGVLLAGYIAHRQLLDKEFRLLKTLTSARLVQSLVLGAYSIQQDPNNTYVTSTEKANGWELLKKLRVPENCQENADLFSWKTIAEKYLIKKKGEL